MRYVYAEQGMNYCGMIEAENGSVIHEQEGSLEWSEVEDEDDWAEVIGPEYVLELPHFGG